MKYPLIAVVGPSGSGKSSSLRNLPKDKTVILNVDEKILPFKEAFQFGENNINCSIKQEFDQALDRTLGNDKIEFIVVESFTFYSDKVLELSKRINKGYEIYNFYAEQMITFLNKIKKVENKWIILLALDELVEEMSPTGVRSTVRKIGVNGQKLEGKIETHFSIVLFTHVKKTQDGKESSYNFITNNDGTTTAKSPAAMLPPLIDNDINLVINKIKTFYNIKEPFYPVK